MSDDESGRSKNFFFFSFDIKAMESVLITPCFGAQIGGPKGVGR